jgi:hypothetical protein
MIVLVPSDSLVDLTERYHLLSFLLFFFLVGVAHTLSMLIKTGFHFVRDVLEEYDHLYDFLNQRKKKRGEKRR